MDRIVRREIRELFGVQSGTKIYQVIMETDENAANNRCTKNLYWTRTKLTIRSVQWQKDYVLVVSKARLICRIYMFICNQVHFIHFEPVFSESW